MDYFDKTNLAATSKRLFNDKLKQFIDLDSADIGSLVSDPERAVAALTKQTNIAQTSANRHLFYSAVVAYLKHTEAGRGLADSIKDRWIAIQKANWETRRQQSLNNLPSEGQQAVAQQVTWEAVIAARDSLVRGSAERLLLGLYTYLPPLRADYYEVRINPPPSLRADPKANFVVLGPGEPTLTIRDFKTAAKYKEIQHVLPAALVETIQESLAAEPRNYLFVMPTDKTRPYDRNGFSKWANKQLQSIFKVPITLTSLRHLFVSTLDFNTKFFGSIWIIEPCT
jgi:hypothetical protein